MKNLSIVCFCLFVTISLTAQKGWITLFDGKNLDQWHSFKKDKIEGWIIENGILVTDGKGGDLVTNNMYTDFILEFDFKANPKGNSGVIYKVIEKMEPAYFSTYASGPEFQIIDDVNYPAQLKDVQKTGANYDMHAPKKTAANPAGQWNHGTIKIKNNKVTHLVNGVKVVQYTYGDDAWKKTVAASKFAKWPYATPHAEGKIALQGHDDPISYRNIKIKIL